MIFFPLSIYVEERSNDLGQVDDVDRFRRCSGRCRDFFALLLGFAIGGQVDDVVLLLLGLFRSFEEA